MAHQLRHRQNVGTSQFCVMASLKPHFHDVKCEANTEVHPLHWKAAM